jgi:hypothetical protein
LKTAGPKTSSRASAVSKPKNSIVKNAACSGDGEQPAVRGTRKTPARKPSVIHRVVGKKVGAAKAWLPA